VTRAGGSATATRPDAGARRDAWPLAPLPTAVALAAILGLAVAVRSWRLGWGLEQQLAFPDELAVWRGFLFAFSPPRWEALLGQPVTYPPLYGYLAGLAVASSKALGLIGPERNVFEALLVARAVSVAAGAATVLLVFCIAARAYGSLAGILAAALVASFPPAARSPRAVHDLARSPAARRSRLRSASSTMASCSVRRPAGCCSRSRSASARRAVRWGSV
jgi:hypothetical protein